MWGPPARSIPDMRDDKSKQGDRYVTNPTINPEPQTTDDPLEAAMGAKLRPMVRAGFGQLHTNYWFCALVKGTGKVPFDPAHHAPDTRRTAVEMTLTTLGGETADGREIEPTDIPRQFIAESAEWTKLVRPGLAALGRDLRSINGAWVQVEFRPTGRKYIDRVSGEEREATTVVPVKVFSSEDECRQAANAFFSQFRQGGGNGHTTAPAPASAAPAPQPAAGMNRETALKFLAMLWQSSNGDLASFQAKLNNNPGVSAHFSVDSPETLAVMQGQQAS